MDLIFQLYDQIIIIKNVDNRIFEWKQFQETRMRNMIGVNASVDQIYADQKCSLFFFYIFNQVMNIIKV